MILRRESSGHIRLIHQPLSLRPEFESGLQQKKAMNLALFSESLLM